MFSQVITSTAMTTNAANSYFSERIIGYAYQDDNSFLSTLRALLDKRIGDDSLCFKTYTMAPSRGELSSPGRLIDYYHTVFDAGNSMTLVSIYASYSDDGFALIKEHYADREGWIRLDPITDFFRRSFDVLCFVNAQTKQSVFFVKDLNMRKYHQLQVGILTALPWYFNPKTDDRPSEIEMELFQSLQEKTGDHYCGVISRIAAATNFEAEYTRRMLNKIESVYTKRRLDGLNAELESLHNRIRDYEKEINTCCIQINERSAELIGLETKIAKGEKDSMICDYFLSNENLKLESVSRDVYVYFHVNTYMTYFNSDIAETYLDNPNSDFYRCHSDWSHDEIRKFFTMIFVDQSIRVRMCAAYKLDLRGSFEAVMKTDFNGDECDRIPNPHIAHYECLGDYRRSIERCLTRSDYIGVLENASASAMSVNVADAPVFRSFVSDIFSGVGGSCYELEDGRRLNIQQVREYVKKEMEEENE